MPSSDQAAARRFLGAFALAAVAFASALVGLCWATDPTGLLRARGLAPELCAPGIRSGNERHFKSLMARVLQPDEVIVGSSRALRGFNAASFPGGPSVNLGMSGATLAEIDALARHAAQEQSVQRIWIGLDFGSFIVREGFREPLIFPSAGASRQWTALRHGLFDQRALRAALLTFLFPDECANPPVTANGFPVAGAPLRRVPAIANRRPLATLARRWALAGPDKEQLYGQSLRRLDRLLAQLQSQRKTVVVYLGPTSSTYRAAIQGSEHATYYRRWRSDVEAVSGRHHAIFVAGDDEQFLSSVVRQACAHGANSDCLFTDAVHFRPEAGAAIVRAAVERSERAALE